MQPSKWNEVLDELRTVLAGRNSFFDAILPPILFLLLNGWLGFQAGMIGALSLSAGIALVRVVRKQPLTYALAGVGSVAIAVGLAWVLGRSEGYFLPGILSGSMTLLLTLLSLVIRRPLVAWTSYLARRWPWDWYWHPRVRPAYDEVTIVWSVFFAVRLVLQFVFFQNSDVTNLGLVTFITGWPATILLLVASYLYGTWRLVKLGGPSVEEFKNDAPMPWQSQRKGF